MSVTLSTDAVSSRIQAAPAMKEKLLELFRELESGDNLSSRPSIVRVAVDLPTTVPVEWLKYQKITPRLCWSDRDNQLSMAGVGAAESFGSASGDSFRALFKSMSERLKDSARSARYFGGMSFGFKENGISNDDGWRSFDRCRFILPRFEMIAAESVSTFVCNIIPKLDLNKRDSIFKLLDTINFNFASSVPGPIANVRCEDNPDRERWMQMISRALGNMEAEALEKVVLARQTVLEFSEPPDPADIIALLQSRAIGCSTFLFQFCSDKNCHAFLGATPELLYRREKNRIFTEAVAGTRPRGKNPQQDSSLEEELLNCDKDIREHHYVVRSVTESLKQLCSSFGNGGQTELMKLARLQHLMKRYEGTLQAGTTDADIISCLHPTPAVGGFPTEDAIAKISELEPFDRGWYAGPVGWLSSDSAEFAVAIRSGLLRDDRLTLYSGAGIIRGSLPAQEWDEVESKISNFIAALDG